MIQDIQPHKLFNQYDPAAQPEPGDFAFFIDGPKVALKNGSIPAVADFGMDRRYTYLFSVDAVRFFRLEDAGELPEGFVWTDVFAMRREAQLPKHQIFAALTAKHLADWYRDTKFCGRCGSRMRHSETERAMKCPDCGNTVYPRIMPAVIVGVCWGDRLLLTQYRTGYGHNALIAGFTEIGETLEETVAREVMEEAGLRVKNIRYYKSQPWAVANDILAGFFCDVDGDTEIHMDANELKVAHWVPRKEIVLQPDDFSLTNEMMTLFRDGQEPVG